MKHMPDKSLSWIEDDLLKAREMLERFSPTPWERKSGVDCGVGCRQLFHIGGDYYDFLLQKNGTYVFAIGDVSGKGISAALMLANLRAVLHEEMQRDTVNLAGMVSKLNRLVYEASPEGSYITFFYGQYDQATSKLHYVNAGHNPPLIFRSLSRKDPPKELLVGGCPLGLFLTPPEVFEQGTESFRPGDILLGYTDGVTEIANARNEEWGLDRLIKTVEKNRDLSAHGIVNSVLQESQKYAGEIEAIDDMTLVVLKALR